jgi:hypothetical protein
MGGCRWCGRVDVPKDFEDAGVANQLRQAAKCLLLAVTAFEEAGKTWMCVVAMLVPDYVRPEWPYGELQLN